MIDHLALHLQVDQTTNWESLDLPPPIPVEVKDDWHLQFIKTIDQPKSKERAELLATALKEVRSLAAQGSLLTFELFCEIQGIILRRSKVDFRKTTAFGKQGREKYGFHPDIKELFVQRLLEHQTTTLPPAVRAARAYLDVCFFHPFPDGNARAARLAFDYILTASNLSLKDARPIFCFARFAGNATQYRRFAALIATLSQELSGRTSRTDSIEATVNKFNDNDLDRGRIL